MTVSGLFSCQESEVDLTRGRVSLSGEAFCELTIKPGKVVESRMNRGAEAGESLGGRTA